MRHIPADSRGLERSKVQKTGRSDGTEGLGEPSGNTRFVDAAKGKECCGPQRYHKVCGGEALAN